MKRDAIQLVRSIYRANKAKDKVVYLEAFLDDFELLKFEIRLCVDMKILAIKKQAELSGLMDSCEVSQGCWCRLRYRQLNTK